MAQNETAELSQLEHVLISRPLRDVILTWFNRGNLRPLSETSKTIRSLICGPFFFRAKHAYTKGSIWRPRWFLVMRQTRVWSNALKELLERLPSLQLDGGGVSTPKIPKEIQISLRRCLVAFQLGFRV